MRDFANQFVPEFRSSQFLRSNLNIPIGPGKLACSSLAFERRSLCGLCVYTLRRGPEYRRFTSSI